MNKFTDKINSGEYIYSAHTKWGLKRYVCDVEYFTEEPLDDLYFVICSVLASNESGYSDKRSLGTLLGFSMINQTSEGKHDVYYDVAEVRIFEDILAKVEEEHLIYIREDDIFLSQLGKISLQEHKHYRFYLGQQNIYEHSMLKSEMPTALLMFPFWKDMGIKTVLQTTKQVWPDDEDIESIIYSKTDQLKKRIELHSENPAKIYKAELEPYFDLEVRKIPVKLYINNGDYFPIVMNGNDVAVRASELLDEKLNAIHKENIILECLFQKLWDDKSAILDYKALEPYVDLIDYEELTKDARTVWMDRDLFKLIVERANTTCWRNISRNCSIDVIQNEIPNYKEFLDWPILTERVDDSFIIDKFLEYPWDLEVISGDYNRKETVIEQLILLRKVTEDDWDWDELGKRLSENFVLNHLDAVKVDLKSYTKDTEEIREIILNNLDKKWDWGIVESLFDIRYIYENIDLLLPKFNLVKFFDRIFIDAEWSNKFAANPLFVSVVSKESKQNGTLSSAVFNDRDYLWTETIIDLLEQNELISWASTAYMNGLECNPNIEWTKAFFEKYSDRVGTEKGYSFVSAQINDVNIISKGATFLWDWDIISSNQNLLSDVQLYNNFGSQLNWTLVLEHQTDVQLLQSLDHIDNMIGNNENAWTAFSKIASIDFVIDKYKKCQYPWDWNVLTERMFSKLKLENLGNKLFIDKWNWTYLSKNINIDFINTNLERFSGYWDWDVLLPRLLNQENKYDYTLLDKLAVILTNISCKEKCQKAWTALTSQYSFKDLKRIFKETVRKRAYWWDMNYFCQHKEFSVFRDLEECRNFVDWDILSSSNSVDNSFKYNHKIGIKEKAWHDEIRKILMNGNYRWNFKLLSHFESLRDERWFIAQFKAQIDWDFLSQHSKLFCVEDKQQLNEIIEAFKKYIDFTTLSERDDIDIEQIIKINPNAEYDFNSLIERDVIKVRLSLVEEKPNYEWDWYLVTSAQSFIPTSSFLKSHISCNINWEYISSQDNPKIWSDEELLVELASDENISNRIDWHYISSIDSFPITREVLHSVPVEKLNWKRISKKKSIAPFIDDYAEYIDWKILSDNRHVITMNVEILNKYKQYLDWGIICHNESFVFTNDIIERFADYIDWDLASDSHTIKFSKSFVDKYKERWNWPVLVKNKAFNNMIDISTMPYARQINIVEFVDRFPQKPKAYHFTHMENAIKIIRAMKLQCRNYADGNFSNSAGSNVNRTAKAHRFARFYFVPKSPTQFYNEFLGKDIDDRKYYEKALKLGLPKCPLPVFFIFDIEELLSVMPDLCYYSNGNMQKDASKCFKVVENPNRIKAREIYINSFDTFDERQQEFLVEGELDFSKLKHVSICCSDSYQAEMLKKELKGTKWADVVTVNGNLYEHDNKELYYYEKTDAVEISTNYHNPFEFKIVYSGADVPVIVNSYDISRQRGNSIYVKSHIEVKKNVPFEIYFEVDSPRAGSWLIYKNDK